ncbi:MAG: ImmA/IrrE family metallo-endopeptidase [Bryobacterales bacterium]|nr:ImmA/IrrE family metallo-endopeptidase [Bryobacterales bacterium]
MPTRWERLAGDTDVFAVKVGFMDDPDDGHAVDTDLCVSWGSFQIWVQGTNLCAHLEEGETVESSHWYLLPLLEWIARSWDPMLHEERLPCSNNATDGWSGLRRNALPSPALDERTEETWEADWQQWWSRHAIAAASEGGLFPDVVFRRFRDLVEISWGHCRPVGIPEHVSFLANGPEAVRLKPKDVAEPLYEVVKASADYLSRVSPDSARVRDLNRAIRGVATPRVDGRLRWLAGAGIDDRSIQRGWQRAKRWFSELPPVQNSALLSTQSSTPLVVEGSCHAALMYGSVSPSITKQDMLTLARTMIDLHSNDGDSDELAAVCRAVPLETGDRPWAQGYELAQDVRDRLGDAPTLQIDTALDELGIETIQIELADTSIRGVAFAGPHHRPGIAWNSSCPFNENPEGQRFTAAHELCHILFDRDVGKRLAVVSGRWAPLGIEQRANAFAAMFLMPADVVRDAVVGLNEPIVSASAVATISFRLRTGFAATLWHLHNLGFIDDFDRQRVQDEWRPAASQS